MCTDCQSEIVDPSNVLEGCNCKHQHVSKVRLNIELEFDDVSSEENAEKMAAIVKYLSAYPDVKVKGFHINIW